MTRFSQDSFGETRFSAGIIVESAQKVQLNYNIKTASQTAFTNDSVQQAKFYYSLKSSNEFSSTTSFAQNTIYSFSPIISTDFPEIKLWGAQGIILTEDL